MGPIYRAAKMPKFTSINLAYKIATNKKSAKMKDIHIIKVRTPVRSKRYTEVN